MKRLAVAFTLCLVLAGSFIFGIFSAAPVPMMGSFCLWTPAAVFLGYSLATAGIKVSVGVEENRGKELKRQAEKQLSRRRALMTEDIS